MNLSKSPLSTAALGKSHLLSCLVVLAAMLGGAGSALAKANTAVAATSSLNPVCAGQSVAFTATVTALAPGTGTPNGTVTFKDGATTLATITLTSGVATFSTSTLSAGAHS